MIENLLTGIEKPGRYLGGEINAYRKDFNSARVRFALAFPDVYEVGLSHLGLRILYHQLNSMEGVLADRVYTPWFDFEERLRSAREHLRCVDTQRPLRDFDFVGFSLQYELSYSNILTMLDLGGIPLEASHRGPGDPWIIAGGPCAYNPEPLADFFDFIVLGEAEGVLPELIQAFAEWKESGGSRHDFLRELRKVQGIYIPSFFEFSYETSGRIASCRPLYKDYTVVKKRLSMDIDELTPIPERPIVPTLDIVHNRLGLEIARGCTRGCRFCQAGFIYRPVRERDPSTVLKRAEMALSSSGFEELSLLSLSTGDYCQIQHLLAALMERFAGEKTAVSFPSMRVGTLTPELMHLIRKVRKTGFTLAPEAGSERLRRVINKGILDRDLLDAANNAFRLGWNVLKLYFMIGLPTETAEDLDAMVALCMEVWKLARASRSAINVSVSTFVPKPLTPFQWVGQIEPLDVQKSLDYVRDRLNRPGIRFKWNQPEHSLLEAVFARGDRRLSRTLKRAWELGVRFDGWTERFRNDLWIQAFSDTGLDPSFYAQRQRMPDEILPWDHLSAGVQRDFLWQEYQRACSEEFTPDCRWDRCSVCGVCDHNQVKPHLFTEKVSFPPYKETVPATRQEHFMYWLRYSKLGRIRFFGQLEIAQSFARAIRRAKLPAAYSEGFHPHVKLSFVEALPLGFESRVEEMYLTLTEEFDPEKVKAELNRHLPEGLHIEEVNHVLRRLARPQPLKVTYRISDLKPGSVNHVLHSWSGHLKEELTKKTKRGVVKVELGDVLCDVRQISESTVELDIREGVQTCFRPIAVLKHILGEEQEDLSECLVCKVASG